MKTINMRLVSLIALVWALMFLPFLYGFASARMGLFPQKVIDSAIKELDTIKSGAVEKGPPEGYSRTTQTRTVTQQRPDAMSPGMTLIAGVGPKSRLSAWIVQPDGVVLHRWDLDWFTLWPNPDHLDPVNRPKARPGTDIHGMLLEPNGDLTFLFDRQGMMKVDVCGAVKWRLPLRTHHGFDRDDAGNFWVLGLRNHAAPRADLPNYKPPFAEDEVLKVSPDGKLLQRFSIFTMLQDNDLRGLLYMASRENKSTVGTEDMLHSNDIDVFRAGMAPGLAQVGDVMISLRNLNSVVIFDPKTHKIKRVVTGHFVRQHDPDFVDGWTLRVFDNNNVGLDHAHGSSRIVEYSLKTDTSKILFQGTKAVPFYSQLMGKQDRLANGNLLISEPGGARAFEIDPQGAMVWQYVNIQKPGLAGIVDEAQRITPETLSPEKLKSLAKACPAKAG